MLGRDHVLLAGVATLGLAPIVDHSLITQPLDLALITVIAAGFGLLPDIDEPNSTIANKLGSTTNHHSILAPITRLLSHIVRTIGGGHRMLTHSLLFVAIIGLGFFELDLHWADWTEAVTFFLASGLALFALLPLDLGKSRFVGPVISIAGAWWLYHHPVAPLVFALTAAAGTFLHMVGDFVTKDGVPWLFPMRKHFALPIVGRTGGGIETVVGAVLSLALVVLMYFNLAIPALHTEIHLPGAAETVIHSTTALVNKGKSMVGVIHLPSVSSIRNQVSNLETYIGTHLS